MTRSDLLRAFQGDAPDRIPHFEHWSCPDAETFLSGIDHYARPRDCRLRLAERYPQLRLPVPETNAPIPRPEVRAKEDASPAAEEGRHTVRWGDGESWSWDWGMRFDDEEAALGFSPLASPDFRRIPVVESWDYGDEDALHEEFRRRLPPEWGDAPPDGDLVWTSFYNTMFMWPLLTFGWERFLEICLDDRFARVMDEFAEFSRRAFRAIARLPVHAVICHDDIVTARGPVCSPTWMHRHVFPRYEEFFHLLKASGKKVVFMADGCMDAFAEDVFRCGADGIITEPYTDFRRIASRHPDGILGGQGDNRVLLRNDPLEIRRMVEDMVETGRNVSGYLMSIGNHIPWNVPPEAVQRYLDDAQEIAWRR